MYLSHPVRRMRDDPLPDEHVTLVIAFEEDGDRQAVADVVAEHDGDIERELQFADWAVRVPETAVAELCEVAGIERIETDNTLRLGPDVGQTE